MLLNFYCNWSLFHVQVWAEWSQNGLYYHGVLTADGTKTSTIDFGHKTLQVRIKSVTLLQMFSNLLLSFIKMSLSNMVNSHQYQ
jgi:hypothetical protein